MGNYDIQLLALAGAQHQIVSREQLLDIGSVRQLEHRLRIGLIERAHRATYRIAGAAHSWRQDVMAACFAGGKLSVCSFQASAELWRLPGGEEICAVTSPRWRRARHDGVIPHESRHLTELDVTYVDNIPVTRPARTLNDMGLLVENGAIEARTLELATMEAVRRGLVDIEQVWREWARLGASFRPGGTATEAMLKGFVPPAGDPDTTPELELLQLVREAGLPEPLMQYRVWLSPTRWCDLDLAWPQHRVFAEFDSYRWHGTVEAYENTINRRIMVENLDWRGVPVTSGELKHGATNALTWLRRHLVRR